MKSLVLGLLISSIFGCNTLERHPYNYSEVCSKGEITDGYYLVDLRYFDANDNEIKTLSDDMNWSRTWVKVVDNEPELEFEYARPGNITKEGRYINEQLDRVKYAKVRGCNNLTFEMDFYSERMEKEINY